jgi:hypothetical protein
MRILSSPSESAMIGPGFGPAIADPHRRWNWGPYCFETTCGLPSDRNLIHICCLSLLMQ